MKQNQFLQYQKTVLKLLEEYRKVIKQNKKEDKGLRASVERKAAPFIKGHFTLAIAGKMNAGKSTFINALLGNRNILPTGHFQTTCVLTKIEYGEKKSIEIVYGDGHKECIEGDITGKLGALVAIEPQYESLPVSNINKLIVKGLGCNDICTPQVIKTLEEKSLRTFDPEVLKQYIQCHPKSRIAQEVTIKYPLPEECMGWRIVDTPGVDAVGGIDMETMNFLSAREANGGNNVDAIIFLHRGSDNIEGKGMKSFVENTYRSLSEDARKRIFFVVTNATSADFQDHEEEYMQKAKALFVDPYGIQPDRLMAVDSLMEILCRYVHQENKDAVSLMSSKNAPDALWNEKEWTACRRLLRDIRDTLEDDGQMVNNENMLLVANGWANFDHLRTVLNEFVKSEKTRAFDDLVQTIREDIGQCIEHRKNDVALLQKGVEEIKGQLKALELAELEKNEMLGTIRRSFSKENVKDRFAFIEERIGNYILVEDATYRDVRRETINLYDLADEKKATLFAEMALAFHRYVQIGTSKAFFKRPDFEAIEVEAARVATYDNPVEKKREVPGFCSRCKKTESYTEIVKETDQGRKLQEFKTMAVRHIRLECAQFKENIQNEIDTYVTKVNEALDAAINAQRKHLHDLLDFYHAASPEDLQKMVEKANQEIAVFEKFLKTYLTPNAL